MSGSSRGPDASETNAAPDLFGYYVRGVAELLSQEDDFLPSSLVTCGLVGSANGVLTGAEVAIEDQSFKENNDHVGFCSLFFNAAGAGLSDYKKERVKAVLRQAVVALTREVDEMLDPVISMRRLRCLMAPAKSYASCKEETENYALKKRKLSFPSSINNPLNASHVSCSFLGEGSPDVREGAAVPGKSFVRCCNIRCAKVLAIDKSKQNAESNGSKLFCDDCLKQANASSHKDLNESRLGSSSRDNQENEKLDDDLQVLLVNRGPKVEEKMEKHSVELSASLEHMEEKLEELLDIVISSCRPMTLAEKHQLCKLIKELPPKNLDRVVEIIRRKKASGNGEEVTVNVQHEDDLTLWRLYYYVAAVENARKL